MQHAGESDLSWCSVHAPFTDRFSQALKADFFIARGEMDTRRKRNDKPEVDTKRLTRAKPNAVLSQRLVTPYTLFSEGRKFASVVVDEAHDYRTMMAPWEAVCEAVDRSSVRIAMTATPIVTSPMVSSHTRSAPTLELIHVRTRIFSHSVR